MRLHSVKDFSKFATPVSHSLTVPALSEKILKFQEMLSEFFKINFQKRILPTETRPSFDISDSAKVWSGYDCLYHDAYMDI